MRWIKNHRSYPSTKLFYLTNTKHRKVVVQAMKLMIDPKKKGMKLMKIGENRDYNNENSHNLDLNRAIEVN